jgi:hypothetical protein
MRSRLLRTYGVPALVCAVALSMASVAASAAAAKATAKAVAKGAGISVSPALPGGAVGARATSILGAAWHADNSPVPLARVRLRNVLSGRIAATTTADDRGQFAFNDVDSGSYVIELVSENGRVLAIGHTFTVAPGETIATFVRLGAKSPWFSGFFGNAASGLASMAASTGVTAVAPEEMPCASPPCSE